MKHYIVGIFNGSIDIMSKKFYVVHFSCSRFLLLRDSTIDHLEKPVPLVLLLFVLIY